MVFKVFVQIILYPVNIFLLINVKHSYFMTYYCDYWETHKCIISPLFPVKSVLIHNGSSGVFALVIMYLKLGNGISKCGGT